MDVAHVHRDGLEDDPGDLVRALDRDGLRRGEVVERRDDGRVHEFLHEPLRRRDGVRALRVPREMLAGLDGDHEDIMGPVVAALELQDPLAARDAPREPNGEEGRVEARHRELEAVHVEPLRHVVRERRRIRGFEPVIVPLDTRSRIAFARTGWLWPATSAPKAMLKSMYSFPSTSHTRDPLARRTYSG